MTSTDAGGMTALQELLAERQRYEGWLTTLEARKGDTAPHVYARVHADYSGRLERVTERLSEQTEQLRGTIEVLTSRLNALRAREADRIDARQEAELRAAVGEYTDEEWTRLRDDADLEIEMIAEERRSVEEEVAELERIMELTRPPDAMGSVAPPAEEPPVQVQAAEPPPPPRPQRSAPPQSPPRRSPPHEPRPAPAAAAPPAPPSAPPPVLGAPPHHPPVEAVDEEMPPIAVRDQEKTLRCPECGTMNYATEWYCERCGGELATF